MRVTVKGGDFVRKYMEAHAKQASKVTNDAIDRAIREQVAPKPARPGNTAVVARRKASTSPTQRSLKMLRAAGFTVEKVEQRLPIPGRFVTRDLFNLWDLLAIHPVERIIGVQVTTMANKSAHVKKLAGNPVLNQWRAAGGRGQLHCWRMVGPRGKRKSWECEVTEL